MLLPCMLFWSVLFCVKFCFPHFDILICIHDLVDEVETQILSSLTLFNKGMYKKTTICHTHMHIHHTVTVKDNNLRFNSHTKQAID